VIREENGVIYHEITVVPGDAEAGRGLVPARIDRTTGDPLLDATGHTQLDYDRSTPNMLLHFLPNGLLGLGLAALLACLMSGLAACITAFNTVFTYDLYQALMRKAASDRHSMAVGNWAALGGILLAVGVASLLTGIINALDALLLVFSLASAPQLATFLLGMFSKRATGHGAFAGLAAGTAAALLHYGLTLPADAHAGIHGGWIAVLHHYPSLMAQCFWTAIAAFAANLIVAVAVSLCTKAKPEAELKGLVHWLTPRSAIALWWKRPGAIAAVILVAALVLGVCLA
jgi:SSS family solute:Na+ symporter